MSSKPISDRVFKEVSATVCASLSSKYGFPYEEAMEHLSACSSSKKEKKEKKEKKAKKPSMLLPFLGVIQGLCGALVLDSGLFTQCKREAKGEKYCVQCVKEHKYGEVEDRVQQGSAWRSPDGKEPVLYSKVMLKKGLEHLF